jgi:APA family basic amino acid/polyamine antiporter
VLSILREDEDHVICWLLLSSERKLFARSTSGLLRGIGPITALLVSIAYTVGWGWQRRIYQFSFAGPLPENLWFAGIPPGVMSFVMGGIIFLIIILGYSILTSAMPRSGGGYVAISRIISPFAAFVGSWLQFFSIAGSLGLAAVWVFELSSYIIGPGVGISAPPTSYNDVGILVGGLLVIILTTSVVALGVRITGYVLQALVWIPGILAFYIFYLLGTAIVNPAVLQNGITAWAQAHGAAGVTADTYVKAALAQGLDEANVGNYWTAVSVTLLGVYYAFIGYAALTFVAGEVRNPRRNFPKVVIIAPIIIMIIYVTMAAFGTYSAASVGHVTLPNGNKWSFFEAYSYLSGFMPGNYLQQAGLPNVPASIPVVASMVGMGLGLGSLNILLFIFSLLWIVNDLPAMALVGSRVLFAMSFDRVLPAPLSKVNNRFNSPIYATILVGAFAVLGALSETCVVCTGGSWSSRGPLGDVLTSVFSNGFLNTDLLDAVFFSLFALAVVLFPFRQKRMYDSAPFKPGGKLGVLVVGLAGLTANLVIAWLVLTTPLGSYNILSPTPANWFALEFTGLLGVIGALIYAYYRFGPSRKEVDYSTIFSEIPPE